MQSTGTMSLIGWVSPPFSTTDAGDAGVVDQEEEALLNVHTQAEGKPT